MNPCGEIEIRVSGGKGLSLAGRLHRRARDQNVPHPRLGQGTDQIFTVGIEGAIVQMSV